MWQSFYQTCESLQRLIEGDARFRLARSIAAVFGFLVLLATAWQVMLDLGDRREERQIRRDESIARAWDRLLQRAPGNTGKGEALGLLFRERVSIDKTDLSCEAIGSWNDADGVCLRPALFAGIDVNQSAYANLDWSPVGLYITDVDLRDAEFADSVFVGVSLNADLRGARLEEIELRVGGIWADWDGAIIQSSDIIDAELGYNFRDGPITINATNVSGSLIPADVHPGFQWDDPFLLAWADWPPIFTAPSGFVLKDQIASYSKVSFCEPPRDTRGRIIDRMKRKGMVPKTGILKGLARCHEIPLSEAQRRYPDAFSIPDRHLRRVEP